jgi:hypothetical protein
VDDELKKLPESLSENPQGLLLKICQEFLNDVEAKTRRNPSYPQFFKRLYEICSNFQKNILGTELRFSVDFVSQDIPLSAPIALPPPQFVIPTIDDIRPMPAIPQFAAIPTMDDIQQIAPPTPVEWRPSSPISNAQALSSHGTRANLFPS